MRPGSKKDQIVAIDAGTTSIRVLCYDKHLSVVAKAQQEFAQHFPSPGLVEHDAEEIWRITKRLLDRVLRGRLNRVAGIGITNQRETTVLWNSHTGKPTHRALVWQDKRTTSHCQRLRQQGREALIRRRTGLVLDSYFSATKLSWLLKRHRGRPDNLLFGTIDSWLIWKLTEGRVHATDCTNASRTLLYNIHSKRWDPELLKLFRIPASVLPEVKKSADDFGSYRGIPITGVAGDQQAALFGQGGWQAGDAKNTYGTGCFLLFNTGQKYIYSKSGLLTTLTPGPNGEPVYALEGSVFIGGAVVQWLRDQLGVIKSSAEIEQRASSVKDTNGVYLVPAFAGLGAPHWDQEARGTITGLTRGASMEHIIRAAEESIAFQVADLITAMEGDAGLPIKELFVDGGAARDNFLMQFQADITRRKIIRPADLETTVKGAAMLAGLPVGLWSGPEAITKNRVVDRSFSPKMKPALARKKRAGWDKAIQTTKTN